MNIHDIRAGAQLVACPDCPARPGDPCKNLQTGAPLLSRPAHERRLWNAQALGHIVLPEPVEPEDAA